MIYLREMTHSDLELLYLWRQDPSLKESLVGPSRYTNIESEEEWFESYMGSRDQNCRLMICLKSDHVPVGRVDLVHIDAIYRSAEFQVLIGDPAYRARGYGRQATLLCLEHGFYDKNLHRIYLSVRADNDAALRLYRSCHFTEEGIAREAAFKNGKYVNVIQMAVLSHEFFQKRGGGMTH